MAAGVLTHGVLTLPVLMCFAALQGKVTSFTGGYVMDNRIGNRCGRAPVSQLKPSLWPPLLVANASCT